MNRRKILGVVAAVSLVSAGIGWFAGQQIKSPAEIAADTAAPAASLITVPVEARELSSNIVVRGQVRFSDSTQVSVEPSVAGFTIITDVPTQTGGELAEGDVLVEIAGRPVLALQGDLPVFRNLTPSMEGPDVQQLEEALVRLGFDPGTVDETYTEQTESAVRGLYERVGYAAEEPGPDQTNRLVNAAEDVRRAEQALRDARSDAAGGSTPESQRRALDLAVQEAQTDLTLTTVTAGQTKGQVWMEAAVAAEDAAAANTALVEAMERLASANSGVDPDSGEPITPDRLAQVQAEEQFAQDVAAAASAEAKASAQNEERVFIEQDGLVASAQGRLDIAIASRKEGLANVTGTDSQDRIKAAQEALTAARRVQTETQAEVGVRVPSAEIVFLPRLPQQIERVNVSVGENLGGPIMRITGSEIVIDSSVAAADRPLLNVGDQAIVDDAATGISFAAEITELADQPGGGELAADRFGMKLKAVDGIPEDALDRNLRVTIPFGSTGGEVLAVPLAALSANADGSSRVAIERADGEVEFVRVVPGLRAGGLVEITPEDGSISEGDRAVVGRQLTSGDPDGSGDEPDDSGDDPDDSEDASPDR